MYYIIPSQSTDNIVYIQSVITNPYSEQEVEGGFYVDHLPKPYTPEGMFPVLMLIKDKEELFYNYEPIPIPPEPVDPNERIKVLEDTLAELMMIIMMEG